MSKLTLLPSRKGEAICVGEPMLYGGRGKKGEPVRPVIPALPSFWWPPLGCGTIASIISTVRPFLLSTPL